MRQLASVPRRRHKTASTQFVCVLQDAFHFVLGSLVGRSGFKSCLHLLFSHNLVSQREVNKLYFLMLFYMLLSYLLFVKSFKEITGELIWQREKKMCRKYEHQQGRRRGMEIWGGQQRGLHGKYVKEVCITVCVCVCARVVCITMCVCTCSLHNVCVCTLCRCMRCISMDILAYKNIKQFCKCT